MKQRIVSFTHLLQLLTTPSLKIYAPFFLPAPYPSSRHYRGDKEQLCMFSGELGYLLWVHVSLDSGTVTTLL